MIVDVVLVGLVAYRIWRLLALDRLFNRLRVWIIKREWQDEFVLCAWCFGFWITGAVTLLAYFLGYVEDWAVTWIAASVIVGFLGDHS